MQNISQQRIMIDKVSKVVLPQRKYLPICVSEYMLKFFYKESIGRSCNFENPRYFTEKLQWYQLYYEHPDFPKICDKAEFKKYISDKIGDGYTAKLYGVWDNVDDIEIDKLPNSFVLKSNCSSEGKNIIIVKDKSKFDFESRKKEIKKWLNPKNTMVSRYGRSYWKVKPMIMAEEYIESFAEVPVDYKFYCFDGKPLYAYTAYEHFIDGKAVGSKISFYDKDWNVLNATYECSEKCPLSKPKHFDDMIKFSEILSKDFPFVRVDFYDTDEQIYVGELTFYPAGGLKKYNPDSFDLELGKQFILPKK